MPFQLIHPERFLTVCTALMDGHVSYSFGSKASPLSADPSAIHRIDCSGFVQYVIYHSALSPIRWPAGSYNQEVYCRDAGFRRVPYDDASLQDDWLRIAFLPSRNGNPRHVWFILNGVTLESYGGHGPGSRPWDTARLRNNVSACYELSPVPPACYGSDAALRNALDRAAYGTCS